MAIYPHRNQTKHETDIRRLSELVIRVLLVPHRYTIYFRFQARHDRNRIKCKKVVSSVKVLKLINVKCEMGSELIIK